MVSYLATKLNVYVNERKWEKARVVNFICLDPFWTPLYLVFHFLQDFLRKTLILDFLWILSLILQLTLSKWVMVTVSVWFIFCQPLSLCCKAAWSLSTSIPCTGEVRISIDPGSRAKVTWLNELKQTVNAQWPEDFPVSHTSVFWTCCKDHCKS